jgi:signal transduction histidine kinase
VKPVIVLNPSTAVALRAVEAAGIAVYQYGFRPSMRVDYVSPGIESVLGVSAERFYADPYAACAAVHHDDRAGFEAMLGDDRADAQQGTFRWRDGDGRFATVEHLQLPVFDDAGFVSGFVGLALRAPDPRRRAEDEPWIGQIVRHVCAARIEDIREEERQRLARELHDGLGQLLTGIKLDSAAISRMLRTLRAPVDVVDRLQAITGQIDLAIAQVQHTAEGVAPPEILHGDLAEAVEYEARRMAAKSGLAISVAVRRMEPLPPHVATAALRVFNEALTNVVRHARATAVRVTLGVTRHRRLVVSVRDNGLGLAARASRRQPLGLLGMRERARAIGGTVRVSSVPGHGTHVLMLVPIRLD